MPETSVLETTVSSVRALYDAICREADEDQTRTDDEAALIARVGEKLAELQARVRASREVALEGASPEQDEWESWSHVARKISDLCDELYAREHPMADALGSVLDKIAAAEAKGDYPTANRLLTGEAIALVEIHDLWAAVEPEADDEADNLLPEPTRNQIARLRNLKRILNARGHADAEDFADLVDGIPEEVRDPTAIMPAARAVERAWSFADMRSLWDFQDKADDEVMFWENNGDRYRRLQNLQRSLTDAGQDYAVQLKEQLAEVDAEIAAESFHHAGTLIDGVWDRARSRGILEESPKDAWHSLREDVAALKELCGAAQAKHGLRDGGYPQAAALYRYVAAMTAAADAMDWQEALDQYTGGRAYAEAQDIWSEVGIDAPDYEEAEDEDENPAKSGWEDWQFLHDKMHNLHTRLAEMEHPLADRLGAYLDEIGEARDKQEYRRATDLLVKDAGGFVESYGLWDLAEADDGENLLPEITQRRIVSLADLSRALLDVGHEKAVEFQALVADIPRVVTDPAALIPTSRAVERAWDFADTHSLRSAVPTLPESEQERLFWETNGKLFRELNALHRKLEAAGHPDCFALGEKLAVADVYIQGDAFLAAGLELDAASELADERGLWDAVPDVAEDEGGAGFSPALATIGGSVGRGGKNSAADVLTVQRLLNRGGATLMEDGDCGSLTVRAIEAFQKATFGSADGRVDPDGRTMAALTGRAVIADVADAASDVAQKVTGTVKKTVGAVVDVVDDALGDMGDFLGSLLGGGDKTRS
jgi:hypothetical protein